MKLILVLGIALWGIPALAQDAIDADYVDILFAQSQEVEPTLHEVRPLAVIADKGINGVALSSQEQEFFASLMQRRKSSSVMAVLIPQMGLANNVRSKEERRFFLDQCREMVEMQKVSIDRHLGIRHKLHDVLAKGGLDFRLWFHRNSRAISEFESLREALITNIRALSSNGP